MPRFAKITGTATEEFTGMIYVMSDIHGSKRRFDAVMKQIKLTDEDTLYILGDVIDRGEHGVELLQRIRAAKNMRMILGNHEYMMLCLLRAGYDPADRTQEQRREHWYRNGGDVTHRDIKKLSDAERESLFDWIDALPTELDITVNGRRYKLVHAMPKELFYLAKRPQLGEKYFSVWDRQSGEAPLSGEYTMIFGHTTSHHYQDGSPMRIWHGPDRMDIDCGSAYPDVQDKNAEFIGRLACIRLDDMREFYSGESIY